jgi:hypothetical protein
MKNTERQKFDDAWRDAFQQAEQTPSAEVWSALDHHLTQAEGGIMKRRVIFYQRLAAAAILFALAFGALTAYYASEQTDIVAEEVVSSPKTENPVTNNESKNLADNLSEGRSNIDSKQESSAYSQDSPVVNSLTPQDNTGAYNGQQFVLSDSAKNNDDPKQNTDRFSGWDYNRGITRISVADLPSPEVFLVGKVRDVTIVRKLPAMPASFMAESKRHKRTDEDLWASIGAATGNYSPQVNTGSVNYAVVSGGAFSNRSAASSSDSRGSAYSVGVNLGKRLSDRWILQGGVNYLNQAIGYNSNIATLQSNNQAKAFVADYALQEQNTNSVLLTNPYEINSVSEFISLPVQAGYLLVDRKLGLQLNSGLATDIFLQNTLTDKSGQLDKYAEGAGTDSPYNTFSLSGLLGSELSYKIGTQYRLSVAPGLRYSMSSVLKSESGTANPLVWDLGFRFRYIFK